MLNLLLSQKLNERIPALLPPGVPVAHKTGTMPGDGVHNDAGIIFQVDNRDNPLFILCIFTKDLKDEAPVDNTISRIALTFWETWVKK
jgi:beta-lactamase class A